MPKRSVSSCDLQVRTAIWSYHWGRGGISSRAKKEGAFLLCERKGGRVRQEVGGGREAGSGGGYLWLENLLRLNLAPESYSYF